jgi:hypothetical protein
MGEFISFFGMPNMVSLSICMMESERGLKDLYTFERWLVVRHKELYFCEGGISYIGQDICQNVKNLLLLPLFVVWTSHRHPESFDFLHSSRPTSPQIHLPT